MVEAARALWPCPLSFFPEISYSSPTWIVPSPYQRKEDIFVTRDEKFETKKSVQTLLTLTFLVTSSPLTIPGTNLLVFSILYKVISLSKTYKNSCFGHLFRSSFPCECSHVHVKNSIQFVCFSPVNLPLSV